MIRNKENQKMETTLRTDENECSDKMNVRETERELEKEIQKREKAIGVEMNKYMKGGRKEARKEGTQKEEEER